MLLFLSQAWTQEIPSLSQRIWEDGSGVCMIEFGNWWKKKLSFSMEFSVKNFKVYRRKAELRLNEAPQ